VPSNGLSPELLEEERRLFYVAVTRARDSLTVMCPMSIWERWGNGRDARPSRFLPKEFSPA
jgi:DNA helicase-2/ATP-dependent DNA helicase PcrA